MIAVRVQGRPIPEGGRNAHCLGKAQLIQSAKGHVVGRGIGIAAHAYPGGRQLFRDRRKAAVGTARRGVVSPTTKRAAYREHIMVPFDELYGRLDY